MLPSDAIADALSPGLAAALTEPDGEQFLPGNSAELAELVQHPTLARFTQDEGAGRHCRSMARELTEQRIFDGLDEALHTDQQ